MSRQNAQPLSIDARILTSSRRRWSRPASAAAFSTILCSPSRCWYGSEAPVLSWMRFGMIFTLATPPAQARSGIRRSNCELVVQEHRFHHPVHRGPGAIEGVLPGCLRLAADLRGRELGGVPLRERGHQPPPGRIRRQSRQPRDRRQPRRGDRKSTRLNSSHVAISYAVFCLKKKNSGCPDGTRNEIFLNVNSSH